MSHRTAHQRSSNTPKKLRTRWRTHPELARRIFARWGSADLDAAATDGTIALAPAWITPRRNALDLRPWSIAARQRGMPRLPERPRAWLNPPWAAGKLGTGAWCDRALFEWQDGRLRGLYVLVPEAIDTDWWWRIAPWASEVISLGRVPYVLPGGEVQDAPPQGSTLFVFEGDVFRRSKIVLERWRVPLEGP